MKDKGKLPVGIRFFKALIPGFEQALKLPPKISMILNAGEIPEAAFLVSRRGTWKVCVSGGGGLEFNNNGKSNQGLALTGEGWDSFVISHYLSVGHFLTFEHSGDMHFDILVFDSTTCDKEYPDDEKENIKRKQDQGTTSASYQQKQGFFQVKLQRYSVQISSPFLYIPETFRSSNCLSENEVTLINPSGDKWTVNLKIHDHRYWRKNQRRVRCALHGGWKKFVQENELKVGHICVFKVSRSSGRSNRTVMNVQFIRQ